MLRGEARVTGVALAFAGLSLAASPAYPADKVRATAFADVTFGTIAGATDQKVSQNVCAYSSSFTRGYSVSAVGSGTGGGFALSSGAAELPYDVLWAGSANQTSGTALTAGAATSGFVSGATHQTCNSGPSASASLTIVIQGSALSSARAGSYSGSLQLTIAPE